MALQRRGLIKISGALIISSLMPKLSFAATKLDGDWAGEIITSKMKYPIKLVIGQETASLYSTSQANRAIVSDELQIHNNEIMLRFDEINATFVGKLKGGKIIGIFSQSSAKAADFKIIMHRA